jgi:DNA-directed RNA polymerase subunit omega
MKQYGDAITIFVRPPSLEVLEKRLRQRRTDSEEAIHRRLEQARRELALGGQYQYQVVNDDVDRTVQEICDILIEARRPEDPAALVPPQGHGDRPALDQNTERRWTFMLDELREEQIVKKVGGRFKLSTLIQKRLVALNQGSPALVDLNTEDKMKIVIQEILEDKIYLDTDWNLRIAGGGPDASGPPEMDYRQL